MHVNATMRMKKWTTWGVGPMVWGICCGGWWWGSPTLTGMLICGLWWLVGGVWLRPEPARWQTGSARRTALVDRLLGGAMSAMAIGGTCLLLGRWVTEMRWALPVQALVASVAAQRAGMYLFDHSTSKLWRRWGMPRFGSKTRADAPGHANTFETLDLVRPPK